MLEVSNVRVYDLKESVIACRNAMRLEPAEMTDEEFEKSLPRAIKLCKASAQSPNVKCHDNFLTGIRVSFDMKYTQYITKQFQRYHWFDYVSSSSMMHRLTKMEVDNACNKYVSQASVDQLQKDIDIYNSIANNPWADGDEMKFILRSGEVITATTKGDALYYAFIIAVNDCPMGLELFVRVSTNYKQLQTIYHQRKDHKLKEDWGAFCDFIRQLPYSNEFITGEEKSEE